MVFFLNGKQTTDTHLMINWSPSYKTVQYLKRCPISPYSTKYYKVCSRKKTVKWGPSRYAFFLLQNLLYQDTFLEIQQRPMTMNDQGRFIRCWLGVSATVFTEILISTLWRRVLTQRVEKKGDMGPYIWVQLAMLTKICRCGWVTMRRWPFPAISFERLLALRPSLVPRSSTSEFMRYGSCLPFLFWIASFHFDKGPGNRDNVQYLTPGGQRYWRGIALGFSLFKMLLCNVPFFPNTSL